MSPGFCAWVSLLLSAWVFRLVEFVVDLSGVWLRFADRGHWRALLGSFTANWLGFLNFGTNFNLNSWLISG